MYDGFLTGGDILYKGAAECVARLAAVWPLGIASGAARPEIETMLKGRELDHYFRFIVASGETPASKPAPDPYRKAAALHGHPPETCVAIEDSENGIRAAHAAGMRVVALPNPHYPPDPEALADADEVIGSLHELTPERVAGV